MQPFITRSSRTSSTTTCSLSYVFLSTLKSAVRLNGSTARTTSPTTITTASARDHTRNSSLFRRFGDFYKRFYSTISENTPPAGSNADTLPNTNGTSNACGNESVVHGGGSTITPPNPSGAPPITERRQNPSISSVHMRSFRYSPGRLSPGRTCGPAEPKSRPNFNIHPDNIEVSVYRLVKRLEDHDRLLRALETEIERRNMLRREAQSAAEKDVHAKELQSLQRVYVHIVTHYYDTRVVDLVMKAVEASQSRVAPNAHSTNRPYLPPFPHYDSPHPPVALNKATLNLFHPRVPPPRLLLKISYNLLTSKSAPDAKTYNILLRGFTIHRQNSLAHMVFHSMVDLGLHFDDYSVVAILNLCVKSADYDAFRKVMRILQTQAREGGPRVHRTKIVYEAMIHSAAKFGHLERVKLLTRAVKCNFPHSPLSITLLTGLLRLWAQKRNWTEGKVIWKRMKRLDRIARRRKEDPATDHRAYYQMFQLCKSCGKRTASAKILEEARERGWVLNDFITRPEKTKGLHVTSEIKVPRLAELTPMYARYKRKKLRFAGPGESRRTAAMRLLENAFDSYNVDPEKPRNRTQDDEFLEHVLLPPLEAGKRVRPPDSEPNEERSKIWSEMLSRRLVVLREEILHDKNNPPPDPPKTDGTADVDPLSASPIRWKPDMTAYLRGSE